MSDEQLGVSEIAGLVKHVTGKMLAVFGAFIAAIVNNGTAAEGEMVDIGAPGKLSQLSLPFFWEHEDYIVHMRSTKQKK